MPSTSDDEVMRCWYCGCELIPAKVIHHSEYDYEKSDMACRDHQVPLARGGKDRPSNIVMSCLSCNARKGKKTVEEYRQYLEMEDERLETAKKLLEIATQFDLPETGALRRAAGWLADQCESVSFFGEQQPNPIVQ